MEYLLILKQSISDKISEFFTYDAKINETDFSSNWHIPPECTITIKVDRPYFIRILARVKNH